LPKRRVEGHPTVLQRLLIAIHDVDFKALFTGLEARKTPEYAILEVRIAT